MAFSDRLAAMRDWLRHKWMYRKGGGNASSSGATVGGADSGGGAGPSPSSGGASRNWFGWLRPVIILIPLAIVLYYGVGMAVVHSIDDNPDFTIPASDNVEGGSKSVAAAAALIDLEVNQHSWTANDPFFQPGWMLDNMPNYQQGIMTALARFGFELTDQLGRTRGSSEADPDLQAAAGLMQYPGDIWLWNPSKSLALKSSSESQYREARRHLLAYNKRLAKSDAVFDRRSDNLLATLDRFAADMGSSSAVIDKHLAESSGLWIDTRADDIFYNTKGRLYAYYVVLTALGEDFKGIIKERNLDQPWAEMLTSLRNAVELSPWVVVNGRPDSQFMPSHLAAQGFYLLRARTQLREITNILLK